MIKIQEHLEEITADVNSYLNMLVEEHWENLNQKLANNKDYRASSVIKKIKSFSDKTSNSEYIKEYAYNNPIIAIRHKAFFDYLLNDEYKELKELIKSTPDNLKVIKNKILKILPETDFYIGTPNNYNQTPFGKLLTDKIFDYKTFRSSPFCKDMFIKLGFKHATCPYCNYTKLDIVTIKTNSTQKTINKAYLDLDHFYPKSLNPFFALSFYNLIPSCHSCNSADKRDNPFSIETEINPYYEAFDDLYEFTIPSLNLLNIKIDEIQIIRKKKKDLDNTINAFNLIPKYNNNLVPLKKLITFFIDNVNRYKGTDNEPFFIDSVLQNIPKNKNEILNFEKGKQNRDILKQLDVNKILGIV